MLLGRPRAAKRGFSKAEPLLSLLRSSWCYLSAIGLAFNLVCSTQPLQSCPTLILWTAAQQAPLSMGFFRQEHWRGLLCPPPGDLPNLGNEPASLSSPPLASGFFFFFFTTSNTWEALNSTHIHIFLSLSLALVLKQLVTKYSNISHPPFRDFPGTLPTRALAHFTLSFTFLTHHWTMLLGRRGSSVFTSRSCKSYVSKLGKN